MKASSESSNAGGSVLIVDDQALFIESLKRALRPHGIKTFSASCSTEALAVVQRHCIELALVDLFLANESGIDLLPDLRAAAPHMHVFLVSGQPTSSLQLLVFKRAATCILSKPILVEDIIGLLEAAREADLEQAPKYHERMPLDLVKRLHCGWVYRRCGQNRSRAAALLQVDRRTLSDYLRSGVGRQR